jgi:hypothetical protein
MTNIWDLEPRTPAPLPRAAITGTLCCNRDRDMDIHASAHQRETEATLLKVASRRLGSLFTRPQPVRVIGRYVSCGFILEKIGRLNENRHLK